MCDNLPDARNLIRYLTRPKSRLHWQVNKGGQWATCPEYVVRYVLESHGFSPEQIRHAKCQAILNSCDPDPPARQQEPLPLALPALPASAPPAQSPPDALDQFIQEHCDVSPTARVLFKDFRVAFAAWLPANERSVWHMERIRCELAARGFHNKPGPHNNRLTHGLALRPLQEAQ